MKRSILSLALLAAALTMLPAASASAAQTYFGFSIGIASAPPPPRVYFRDPPDVVLVPSTRVYVVDTDYDYGMDMFRYGRFYYVMRSGYWYRGRTYRGPFQVVDVRYVPRQILYVPASHWKHHPRGGWPGRGHGDRDHDRGRDRGDHRGRYSNG